MTLLTLLVFLGGLALLIAGAEMLVRGSSRIAAGLGMSPLIIGLTVVAFGTSSPELAVSLKSALSSQGDIALGNVVGSNIFNILFILGVSALAAPLAVSQQLLRFDAPLMVAVTLVFLLLCLDQNMGRLEGFILLAGLVGYLLALLRISLRESAEIQAEYEKEYGEKPVGRFGVAGQLVLVVVGLVILVVGARLLVNASVDFARALGVSELVIGLTIVAAGTSLPEVAASIVAALRGERDIAVGNVVGSCILNLTLVLGLTGLVVPGGIPVPIMALHFDIPVMLAASVACLPLFFTGFAISRGEGLLFLFYYLVYIAFTIMHASESHALDSFGRVILWVILPATCLGMGWAVIRSYRKAQKSCA